ncbi:MAG: zinc-binding dehydrogenase [Bradyrhizobium sp.]|nr:zinc-binding dehydrogenase [Bradyrhizobium sp.]
MPVSSDRRSLELRSKVSARGDLELWLEEFDVPEPAANELVVQIDAAPINPSDMIIMFGPADLSTVRVEKTASGPTVMASIPRMRLPAVAGRIGQALPVGNEGAGFVVKAGSDHEGLVGRAVAFRSSFGTYAQYRVIAASECMILPDGLNPKQAASAFINPLTVLGMVESMKLEGHRALVHTAAASNVGQMLNRLCLKDGIDLVNIVRSEEQAQSLRGLGATHVVNSASSGFDEELMAALEDTGATIAFDAIGGGTMASRILAGMERVQSRKLTSYSRYGSPTHRQVYIYGILDPEPTRIDRSVGTAWSVGGWLMTWFCERIGAEATQRLRDRVRSELTTTFASDYAAEISLSDLLSPALITSYLKRATGQKYLLKPNAT